MGILDAGTLAAMRADMLALIADRQQSITIRRGDSELDPQDVRIARRSSGSRRGGEGIEEQQAGVVVVGDTSFDVQVDDRFTTGDQLYRVAFVRPNRDVMIVAEAVLVE